MAWHGWMGWEGGWIEVHVHASWFLQPARPLAGDWNYCLGISSQSTYPQCNCLTGYRFHARTVETRESAGAIGL